MLGLGVVLDGVRFGVGFDYSPPLQALDIGEEGRPDYLVDRTSVWNARVGAMVSTSETVALGFGAFTDRSAARTPGGIGEFRVDYYGGTFGVRLDTPVGLADTEKADTLVFRTTVALRYAYGTGDTRVTGVDFRGLLPNLIEEELIGVRFHELYAFVGSSLMF